MVDRGDNTVMTRTFSQDLRPRRCPSRLGLLPGTCRRCAQPDPRPVQHLHPGAGGGHRSRRRHRNFSPVHGTTTAVWLPWIAERIAATGLRVTPSAANFVLVEFPDEEGRNAEAALAHLARYGLIPRGVGGNRLPNHLRITVGLEDEMHTLVEAIEAFVS